MNSGQTDVGRKLCNTKTMFGQSYEWQKRCSAQGRFWLHRGPSDRKSRTVERVSKAFCNISSVRIETFWEKLWLMLAAPGGRFQVFEGWSGRVNQGFLVVIRPLSGAGIGHFWALGSATNEVMRYRLIRWSRFDSLFNDNQNGAELPF